MPIISTCLSTSRPYPAVHGDLILETDTNKLIMYDENSAAWLQYGPANLAYTQGGSDKLHYNGGLWDDASATFRISSTPVFHFDSSQPGGSMDPSLSPSDGDAVPTWGDHSGNGNSVTQTSVTHQPYYNTGIASVISGGANTRPAISSLGDYYPVPAGVLPNYAHSTLFFVMCAQGTSYISPFGTYSNWYRHNYDQYQRLYGLPYLADPNFGTPDQLPMQRITEGPIVSTARAKNGNVEIWNTLLGGAPIITESGAPIMDASKFSTVLHTYPMHTWELILFNDDISISDINVVKNYLQGKYAGFPNIASSPDLTE